MVTLEVFHFEISGKEDNDLHPLNIPDIIYSISFSLYSSISLFDNGINDNKP